MLRGIMEYCGKLVPGGPCMRTPGHGGGCFPGRVVGPPPPIVFTPQTIGLNRMMRRALWRSIRNMDTVRFALLAMIFIAQVWIDVVCIMLWK